MPTQLAVPDDLTELDQWVVWRYERRGGRRTKVPCRVTGTLASSTDRSTWVSFEQAVAAWQKCPRRFAGVGYVFATDDPFCGIDLDSCLTDDGIAKEWARGIVERFSDSYTEISPSGKGLKIWARGALPANVPGVKLGDGAVELYDHSRYFAVTGRPFRGAPLQVEDHASDLRQLYERLTAGRKRRPLVPQPSAKIPHGHQHNTLVSLCGTLRFKGICEEAIEACLQIVNEKQCERPGRPQEISRIVRSSRAWELK